MEFHLTMLYLSKSYVVVSNLKLYHMPFIWINIIIIIILAEELGLYSLPGNPTYHLTDFSASKLLDNQTAVITSFRIGTKRFAIDILDSKDA